MEEVKCYYAVAIDDFDREEFCVFVFSPPLPDESEIRRALLSAVPAGPRKLIGSAGEISGIACWMGEEECKKMLANSLRGEGISVEFEKITWASVVSHRKKRRWEDEVHLESAGDRLSEIRKL